MSLNLPKTRGRYRINADIGKMCWFGVGGNAEVLFIPKDIEDIQHFLENKPKEIPLFVFGVGSNILVRDGGIKGIVMRLGRGFNYVKHNNDVVTAGAASMDLNVALYTMENGIGGLEFLSGIPGTIGGALAMNAGAYKADILSILIQATAINHKGEIRKFQKDEIGYFYRGKTLSDEWIFLEAEFKGYHDEHEKIKDKIDDIQKQRGDTQPIKSRTGGSTFKNPPELKAWELIDKAGCRGMSIGDAKVSEQHCNFLINNGNATASELEELIETVKNRVLEKTGITLEEEIKIIGNKSEK